MTRDRSRPSTIKGTSKSTAKTTAKKDTGINEEGDGGEALKRKGKVTKSVAEPTLSYLQFLQAVAGTAGSQIEEEEWSILQQLRFSRMQSRHDSEGNSGNQQPLTVFPMKHMVEALHRSKVSEDYLVCL